MTLSGRVALVTGASQGIGRACALKLAQSGATLALAARSQEKLQELAAEIAAAGGTATAFPLDVSDEEQIKATFKAVIAQLGKIDILVNNAGITRDQLVMRMKRADWDAVLNTNLTSAYLCTQQAISSMLKQRWGRIINITSIFGQTGQAGQANYCRFKSRTDRADHGHCPRSQLAQHHLQRRGSGLHRNRHDFRTGRRVQAECGEDDPARARGHAGRGRERGGVSGVGRSFVHYRARAERERRHADGLGLKLKPSSRSVIPTGAQRSERSGGPASSSLAVTRVWKE